MVTWSLYEMCSVLQLTETCDPKPTCVGFSSAHCVPRVRLRTDDTQGRGTTHTKQRSVRRLQCLWCVLRLFLPCADSCICGLWVGGFFLACEDFGRMFDKFIPRLHFFFFFFEVEISSQTLVPLLRPGSVHSGSVSQDDCGRVFSDKLRVSSFPDRFPHYAWTAA